MLDAVYCANCLDFMKDIPENYIDLTVTSPPYDNLRDYNGYSFDYENIAKELFRITKTGGIVVWVVGDSVRDGNKSLTSFKQALFFQSIGFKVYDNIIYEKAGSSLPHSNRYGNSYEYMFIFSKGNPKTVNLLKDKPNKYAGTFTFGDRTIREKDGTITNKGKKQIQEFSVRNNIWRYVSGFKMGTKDVFAYKHPAMFPEKLAQDHILSWSNEGDIVFDPMCGSGTTLKMARLNNRHFLGCDISQEYVDIAKQRIQGTN